MRVTLRVLTLWFEIVSNISQLRDTLNFKNYLWIQLLLYYKASLSLPRSTCSHHSILCLFAIAGGSGVEVGLLLDSFLCPQLCSPKPRADSNRINHEGTLHYLGAALGSVWTAAVIHKGWTTDAKTFRQEAVCWCRMQPWVVTCNKTTVFVLPGDGTFAWKDFCIGILLCCLLVTSRIIEYHECYCISFDIGAK